MYLSLAVGSGQWAVGSWQWAVGGGQLAVGSGNFFAKNENIFLAFFALLPFATLPTGRQVCVKKLKRSCGWAIMFSSAFMRNSYYTYNLSALRLGSCLHEPNLNHPPWLLSPRTKLNNLFLRVSAPLPAGRFAVKKTATCFAKYNKYSSAPPQFCCIFLYITIKPLSSGFACTRYYLISIKQNI